VDTVLVKIIKQEKPLVTLEDRFEYSDFLAFVFNQRRHNIKNDLLDLFTFVQLKKISKEIKFNLDAAPNSLVLENWVALFKKYQSLITGQKKKQIWGAWAKLLRHRAKLSNN
jgi:23S rRNA (adenine-N6)-dimethyltransferase